MEDIKQPVCPSPESFANRACKVCKGSGLKFTPILQPRAPGRNDKCICDSGKKYKNCCWDVYKNFGRHGAMTACTCVNASQFNQAIERYKLELLNAETYVQMPEVQEDNK